MTPAPPTTDRGVYILTATGRRFHPTDPRPEDFHERDIARGLSNVCRFACQLPRFYSVAEHSVLVSHLVPERYAFEALMHDAEEAYPPGDIPTPIKRMADAAPMVAIQAKIRRMLREVFALPAEDSHAVTEADRWAFVIESRTFREDLPADYFTTGHRRDDYDAFLDRPIGWRPMGLSPREAHGLWSDRFQELT